MTFGDDLNACAALVERGDPVRFRAAMAAPVAARRILFPLFAFNVEVSRAPWMTQEPMIAEMRLQWWRDVCEEIAQQGAVRRHEVATPFSEVIGPEDATALDDLVSARRWDIYKDAFEDADHFERYLNDTAGTLAWIAARRLGQADETVVRDAAIAAGIGAWLCAIPELEARGRIPLLDGTPDGVAALAQRAQARLKSARASRARVSKASRPALLHVAAYDPVLHCALRDPQAVADRRLPDPVESDRMRLPLRAMTGRW